MKLYTKTHELEKAVKGHKKNIKKRGGTVMEQKSRGKKTTLVYTFSKMGNVSLAGKKKIKPRLTTKSPARKSSKKVTKRSRGKSLVDRIFAK